MFFVAGAPFANAIEQSAFFREIRSLIPSPVIATVLPCFFRISTISAFCSGLTLPKILLFMTILSRFSSSLTFDMSTHLSQF